MLIIKFLLYFLSVVLPGFFIFRLLPGQEKKISFLNIFLSYGLGIFFITEQLFIWLFIFKRDFSFSFFVILFLAETIILAVWNYWKKVFPEKQEFKVFFQKFKLVNFLSAFKSCDWIKKIGVLIISILFVCNIFFLIFFASSHPVISYDSMSNWVLRAKILFYENKIYFDQTDSYYYFGGGVHCNYPVLIPLQEFWLSKIESNFNDSSFDWIALFYFLGLLVVSYGFLRKRISMFKSFVFVFFLLTMPLFFCHAYIPYADLPLTFFVFTAFVFFYDWLEKGKQKDLILFGIFSSASFMVKNDAAFFAIPALIIFIIAFFRLKRNWKDFFLLSALSFILIVPQLAIRFIYKQGIKNTDVDFYNFAFHPEVTKSFISSMIASFNWNIWWFLVPLLVIVNLKSIKKDSAMFYGWILAGLYFFELILMYFFTTEFRFVIDHVAFSRTLMPLISFTVLLTGLFFNDKLILKKKEESEM